MVLPLFCFQLLSNKQHKACLFHGGNVAGNSTGLHNAKLTNSYMVSRGRVSDGGFIWNGDRHTASGATGWQTKFTFYQRLGICIIAIMIFACMQMLQSTVKFVPIIAASHKRTNERM